VPDEVPDFSLCFFFAGVEPLVLESSDELPLDMDPEDPVPLWSPVADDPDEEPVPPIDDPLEAPPLVEGSVALPPELPEVPAPSLLLCAYAPPAPSAASAPARNSLSFHLMCLPFPRRAPGAPARP
jgi:hypothetical protein